MLFKNHYSKISALLKRASFNQNVIDWVKDFEDINGVVLSENPTEDDIIDGVLRTISALDLWDKHEDETALKMTNYIYSLSQNEEILSSMPQHIRNSFMLSYKLNHPEWIDEYSETLESVDFATFIKNKVRHIIGGE
jgi:hypothetical protein